MKHECDYCGKNCPHCRGIKNKRKYWKYIIENDEGISHTTKLQKRLLLELIMISYETTI